jgi:hypothetical protein
MKWIYIAYVIMNLMIDSYFQCNTPSYTTLQKKPFRLQRTPTSGLQMNFTNNFNSTNMCKIKNQY